MSDLATAQAPPTAVLPADEPPSTPLTNGTKTKRTAAECRFTSDNARLMAQKSQIARLKAKLETRPEPLPEPEPDAELGIVWAECNRVNAALAGNLKPADRCALAKTLDMLLDRARIIRGLALPGTVSSRAPVAPASQASSMLGLTAPATSPEAARPTRDEQE